MLKAPIIPQNETARVTALHSYNILHTSKEPEYDQLTELAAQITGMPISLISLVDTDEVWFKSTKGMDICSSDRNLSFCSYAVGTNNEAFVLNDIKKNPDYSEHPYANLDENAIEFYAGVCLQDRNGYKLGTLCVIDHKPNTLTANQLKSLQTLAKQVVKLIELHQSNHALKDIKNDLEEKNKALKNFAGVVSHDMKMPLANIILTTDILKAKYANQLDDKAKEYLAYLKKSSFTLSDYITGLLAYYESDRLNEQSNQTFDIHHLLEEIVDLLNIDFDCEINFPSQNIDLHCNRAVLEQILLNLIGNSLKYNDKEKIIIDIDCKKQDEMYLFTVLDNGIGIPNEKQKDIFDLFTTVGNTDRKGNKGNGIGLSTVKKLVTNCGGTIKVTSKIEESTCFQFTIENESLV